MKETTIETKRVFWGKLINLDVVDIQLENGKTSTREIVRHPGAAAIVIYNMTTKKYVFVQQFRKAIERDVIEIVAGGLEKNEHPAVCAVRETKEETGYDTKEIVSLGLIHSSPGYSDEPLHLFFGRVEGKPGLKRLEDDEKVSVLNFSSTEINDMIKYGMIFDSKTIAAWYKTILMIQDGYDLEKPFEGKQ